MSADSKAAVADPENQEKWNKFKAESDAEEQKRVVRQEALSQVFDIQQLLERAATIREVEVPGLGRVRFGELTFEDSFEINKCKTDVEKTEMVAYLMLSKAYPDIPRDFLKRMPLVEGAALIDFLTKQPAFLSPPKSSQPGLKPVRKRKT